MIGFRNRRGEKDGEAMEERTGRSRGLGLRPTRKALDPSSSIWKPMRSCPARDPKETSAEAFRERSNPHLDDDDNLRSPNSPYLVGTCPDMCPGAAQSTSSVARFIVGFEATFCFAEGLNRIVEIF